MKTLIIYESVYHNNTLAIAKAIGDALQADLIKACEASLSAINYYDLIGFGSGIYNAHHHINLEEFIQRLPHQAHKKAFIFSTNTFGLKMLHKPLREQLIAKGFAIIGEFTCSGYFEMFSFWRLNKNRPGTADFEKARKFAVNLQMAYMNC